VNPPDDGLGDLFSGQLHPEWTRRDTRSYAAGCLSVIAVLLIGAAGVWAASKDYGLAWLICGATVALIAALALIRPGRRQRDP
jgi:hypothetical protein